VEAFFATLTRELAWIHAGRSWPTRDLLRSALFDFIEGFYNPTRIQRRLGYRSPADYERIGAAA
jgi:transposase InsO family protein